MLVQGFIRTIKKVSKCYAKSVMTLVDALTDNDPVKLVAYVVDRTTSGDIPVGYIDLSRLYSEQLGKSSLETTWESCETFLSNLPDIALQRYKVNVFVPSVMVDSIDDNGLEHHTSTPFYSNVTDQLNIVGVENAFGIDVTYGSHLLPSVDSIRNLGAYLPDLIFKHNKSKLVDFKNTLPIVNGVVCYPQIINDKLYAHQGARLATKIDSLNKNIVLVDFSPIGDITTVKLSECTVIHIDTGVPRQRTSPLYDEDKFTVPTATCSSYSTSYITVVFDLPLGTNLGYPMICMFGRLFSPDQHNITIDEGQNISRVTVKLERRSLEDILAANKQKHHSYITNTPHIQVNVDVAVNNLFRDWETNPPSDTTEAEIAANYYADRCVPFMVLLHTDKEIIYNTIPVLKTLYKDKLIFPVGAGGMLMNTKTMEIIDYVRVPYRSEMLVTFPAQEPLYLIDDTNPHDLVGKQYGLTGMSPCKRDKYNTFSQQCTNLRDLNNFALVDIATTTIPEAPEYVSPELPETNPTPDVQPVVYIPIISRVTASVIHVDSIEHEYIGNYLLVDTTVGGANRTWKIRDSVYQVDQDAMVGYSSFKRCWYIGTARRHLYESSTADEGSSPWYTTLTWYKVKRGVV